MMTELNGTIPPWHSATYLFDKPAATCELILDGHHQLASVALWEGYCYLKLTDLQGLWGITQPYDSSDLVRFLTTQIAAGEVGRVWDFLYTPSPPTSTPVPTQIWLKQKRTAPDNHQFRLVAIVRFDNSAIIREWQRGPFLATPPFTIQPSPDKVVNKANIPSIWHPNRRLIGGQQIGDEVSGKLYRAQPTDKISQNELFTWKKGSLPELIELLQALCACTYVENANGISAGFKTFNWPLQRGHLNCYLSYRRPEYGLNPLLRVLWDEHHFDSTNWVPVDGIYYAAPPKTRQYWKKPKGKVALVVPNPPNISTHQKIEASLILSNWFKGKISEEQLNEALQPKT